MRKVVFKVSDMVELFERNYEVQMKLDCCYNCEFNDGIGEEGILLCSLSHDEVSPVGICDAYELGDF